MIIPSNNKMHHISSIIRGMKLVQRIQKGCVFNTKNLFYNPVYIAHTTPRPACGFVGWYGVRKV